MRVANSPMCRLTSYEGSPRAAFAQSITMGPPSVISTFNGCRVAVKQPVAGQLNLGQPRKCGYLMQLPMELSQEPATFSQRRRSFERSLQRRRPSSRCITRYPSPAS